MMITLENLNALSESEAFKKFETCCVSKAWIKAMVQNRPFTSENELIQQAANNWLEKCSVEDYKQAFTGHPKIGDVSSLREKFVHTQDWAANEQSKMTEADNYTIEELAKANTLYEAKFGYIFIVSASGKSADEMLAIVNKRLTHDPTKEIYVAMNEQHKITVIRLAKMIEGIEENSNLGSHITTHALDTSIGVPASKMMITLKRLKSNEWSPMSVGITNNDGRIGDVLAPGVKLGLGEYQMVFDTDNYYKNHQQSGFYPEVVINFKVIDDKHYHIPLLINPFGYSTYRGS